MTYCSVVAVPALVGLTKKHFGHYAILKIYPSDHQVFILEALLCMNTQYKQTSF